MTDNLKQRIAEAIAIKCLGIPLENLQDTESLLRGVNDATQTVLDIVEPIESKGWFVPINEHWNELMEDSFLNMMNTIKHGGKVDVVARIDGKDYQWECDGLRHAKFIDCLPTPPEKE